MTNGNNYNNNNINNNNNNNNNNDNNNNDNNNVNVKIPFKNLKFTAKFKKRFHAHVSKKS